SEAQYRAMARFFCECCRDFFGGISEICGDCNVSLCSGCCRNSHKSGNPRRRAKRRDNRPERAKALHQILLIAPAKRPVRLRCGGRDLRPPLRVSFLSFGGGAGKHRRYTFWIDVERYEGQGLASGIAPLVHEIKRFVDEGTGCPRDDLAVDCVG